MPKAWPWFSGFSMHVSVPAGFELSRDTRPAAHEPSAVEELQNSPRRLARCSATHGAPVKVVLEGG